jgi:hypothetical protein
MSAARKAWRTRRHGKKSKRASKKKSSDELWIAGSVKRPGALRATVSKAYGKKGFDNKGRIKVEVLKELRHSTKPRVRQQAQFALNVRGLGK